MATAYLVQAPYSTVLDNNGDPVSGGKIHTYAAGTSTPQVTYTDSSATVNAANPIIADAGGRYVVWANVPLKITVSDANDIQIRTTDNITPTGTVGTNSISNANLAQAPAFTIKGNATGAVANEQDLTVAQVNAMLGLVPFNYISGFMPSSIAGTNTTASLSISAGQASDVSNVRLLTGATFAWAVSNGNAANGYQGGTTLPNGVNKSTPIHFYAIAQSTDSTWTACFAAPTTSPTLPSGYTNYRRIFSLTVDNTGALVPIDVVETEGGAMVAYHRGGGKIDFNVAPTATATAFFLTIPAGIKAQVLCRASVNNVNGGMILTSGDQAVAAPSATSTAGYSSLPGNDMKFDSAVDSVPAMFNSSYLTTNTSGQITAQSTSATQILYFFTEGWKDFRRITF